MASILGGQFLGCLFNIYIEVTDIAAPRLEPCREMMTIIKVMVVVLMMIMVAVTDV